MKSIIVVAWHNPEQKEKFCEAWGILAGDERVHFEQDKDRSGCAKTKNRGVAAALRKGPGTIIILDDDCFPLSEREPEPLHRFIHRHMDALEPQEVEMYEQVTDPPSRGTPYFTRTRTMPVAGSMGFWEHVGDYDAPGQLVHGATCPMTFKKAPIFGKYFPLSGMNLAFRVGWAKHVEFVDLPRWDDIFMGYVWQRVAYQLGFCFNLGGPVVRHSRQSNVWENLKDEAKYMEANETLWRDIAECPSSTPSELKKLIPQ